MKRDADNVYLFDNPRNVKRLMRGLYVCCALLFVLDFVLHRHSEHPWEWLWGFYPVYGFVGCVVLVLVAKWMRKLVMRPPDYYDEYSRGQSHLIQGSSDSDPLNIADPSNIDRGGKHVES